MPESSLLNVIIGFVVAIAVGYLYHLLTNRKKDEKKPVQADVAGSNAIRLQAYERLTLLVDRIALPNIISRTPHEGLTAQEMQLLLTLNIRDEYDYNITQQIYITPEVWQAVKNLKEKNQLIINQVANALPPEASALDLNRSILQYTMNDPKANMHDLVSEALSFEAKKLL